MEIHGYGDPDPERTVSITGPQSELLALAGELSVWTPGGGWSDNAKGLFKALSGKGQSTQFRTGDYAEEDYSDYNPEED